VIADIHGWVYCGKDGCPRKHEAVLRHTSFRGEDRLRVVLFVTFVPTGWTAWVDSEGSCHVLCHEHEYKGYLPGVRYQVKS
jgi:hypothetical protein